MSLLLVNLPNFPTILLYGALDKCIHIYSLSNWKNLLRDFLPPYLPPNYGFHREVLSLIQGSLVMMAYGVSTVVQESVNV